MDDRSGGGGGNQPDEEGVDGLVALPPDAAVTYDTTPVE